MERPWAERRRRSGVGRCAAAATLAWVMLALAPPALAQAAPETVLRRAGCLSCHARDRKLVGPGFRDVAAKYKGRADAVPYLTGKIRKGGAGVFGPVPMPPNPAERINDADLQAVIGWILQL